VQYKFVAVSELKLDPNNARKHSQRNLDTIATSLVHFGQRKPIVITKDNVVVAGNGQLLAARELGWTEIECVQIPDEWDADRIKAYAIADNRTAELAEWDGEQLLATLKELELSDFALVAGFNEQDIKALLHIYGDAPEADNGLTGEPKDPSDAKFVTLSFSVEESVKAKWDEMWNSLEGSDTTKVIHLLTEMGY
jgi:ParB-like chromosome segregation protein Spo0J